jgi:hypothetical protein
LAVWHMLCMSTQAYKHTHNDSKWVQSFVFLAKK